jgi:hypothetical protein
MEWSIECDQSDAPIRFLARARSILPKWGPFFVLFLKKNPSSASLPHSFVHQEERAAIPPALARDMLGIPTYDQGSVATGAHVVGIGGLRPLSYEDLTTALQNDLLAAGYDATHH